MEFWLSAVIVNLGFLGILTPAVFSKANLDTLRQVQIIFRHGARTIDQTYYTDPYKNESLWEPGYSQLTNEGKLQGYNLGLFLRERYKDFVKDTYDLKDIYVQSSDFARTIQTAYSVMAGFYLPNDILQMDNNTDYLASSKVEIPLPWKSVPVHTSPVEYDNILRQTPSICPRYLQLFRNNPGIPQSPETNFFQGIRVLSEYFYNHTGYKPSNIKDTLLTLDALYTEKYYNLTLPNWAQQLLDKKETADLFLFFYEWITFNDEMKRLRAGPLVEKLVHNMVLNETLLKNEFDRSRSGRKKMYLFSAHDETIAGLLNTLGIFNKKRPPLASALIIELHQRQNLSSEFSHEPYLEIYYRNDTEKEPYQMNIPGCGLHCSVENFVNIVRPYIPVNWNQECLILAPEKSTLLSAGWIALIVVCVWIILFALLLFWMRSTCFGLFNKRRRDSSYLNLK